MCGCCVCVCACVWWVRKRGAGRQRGGNTRRMSLIQTSGQHHKVGQEVVWAGELPNHKTENG